MIIEQIYTGCLAHGAYYIESDGEAAIIDPLREVQPYIDKAKNAGASITYIFETHFHADFVSGHLTLAKKTKAPIIFGPTASPSFDAIIAENHQIFPLGKVKIKVLHTPGHTMESTTYLLIDESGKEHSIFTGDTLFLGDVGRPDLAQKAANLSQEELAATLYNSLRTEIMPLPDEVIVYPGHGAGSACGKNMMKETVDTLGNQKKVNYALRADMTEEEFVREVTEGLTPPPAYFPMNVKMNKLGYDSIDEVLKQGETALSPEAFETAANETGAIVLDVRSAEDFAKAHLPRSIFIGLDGNFAPWVGTMIKDVEQPLLLVADKDRIEEAVIRLSRVGFDKTLGFLDGGIDAWKAAGKQVDVIRTVSAEDLAHRMEEKQSIPIFDVRKESEYQSEHITEAENTPLDYLNDHLAEFPKENDFYLHCQGGYRSLIAASILKARGYHNLYNVEGGFKAIAQTNIPKSDYVCPSTL